MCGRVFSMPEHLARHVSMIHGTKTSGKAAEKGPKAKASRRVGRPKGAAAHRPIAAAPVLAQMRAYHADLSARRDGLDAQITAIANALEQLEAVGVGPARGSAAKLGRPAGDRGKAGSLKDFVVQVLRRHSGPMRPKEIAAGVKRAGYKSKTKDLAHAVTKTLPTIGVVKKVGFGLYRV